MLSLISGVTLISTIILVVFDYVWRLKSFPFHQGLKLLLALWVFTVGGFLFWKL